MCVGGEEAAISVTDDAIDKAMSIVTLKRSGRGHVQSAGQAARCISLTSRVGDLTCCMCVFLCMYVLLGK